MRARSTTVGEHHEAYNVGFSTIGIPTTDQPLKEHVTEASLGLHPYTFASSTLGCLSNAIVLVII